MLIETLLLQKQDLNYYTQLIYCFFKTKPDTVDSTWCFRAIKT